MTGCWNWLLNDDLQKIEELFHRYEMAKEFNVQPAKTFDDMPVNLMDGLTIINREFPKAVEARKAKESAKQ